MYVYLHSLISSLQGSKIIINSKRGDEYVIKYMFYILAVELNFMALTQEGKRSLFFKLPCPIVILSRILDKTFDDLTHAHSSYLHQGCTQRILNIILSDNWYQLNS